MPDVQELLLKEPDARMEPNLLHTCPKGSCVDFCLLMLISQAVFPWQALDNLGAKIKNTHTKISFWFPSSSNIFAKFP